MSTLSKMEKQTTCMILAVVLLVVFLFTFSYYDSFVSSHVQTYKLYPILDPINRPFTHLIGSPEADAQLQDTYSILKEERGER